MITSRRNHPLPCGIGSRHCIILLPFLWLLLIPNNNNNFVFFHVNAGIMKTNPCPEVPTLLCQHGSTCLPGNANFGPEHAHLQLQTSEQGYYCDCSHDGYIGHECQISVDKCTSNNGGVPFCYHGAQCVVHRGMYVCDCHTLNKHSFSTAIKYDGSMCQHPSTSYCAASLVENHAPNFQFCTNNGKCNKWVQDSEPHPGCTCLDGYVGERCEIEINDPYADIMAQYNSNYDGGDGRSSAQKAGIALLSIGIILLVPLVVCLVMRARRRKKRNDLVSGVSPTTATTLDGKTVVGEGDLDADGSGTLGNNGSVNKEDTTDEGRENEHALHDDSEGEDEGDNDDDGPTSNEIEHAVEEKDGVVGSNENPQPLSEIV